MRTAFILARNFSIQKIPLAQLQAKLNKPSTPTDAVFDKFISRWRQIRKIPSPFFTEHQDLPQIEQTKLKHILSYRDTLTDKQIEYLGYMIVERSKMNLSDPPEEHLDPEKVIMKELRIRDPKARQQLQSLGLLSKASFANVNK